MQRQQGITLVELLVVLAILAIMVGVVFPGFQNMLARNNMATSANSVLLAVNLARGEAVRQADTTTLVALGGGAADDEWGVGWQVLNVAATTPATPCAAPACIREFGPISGALTLDSPANQTFLQFNSRGGLVGGVPVVLNLCNPGVDGVQVAVTAVGRASTSPLGPGDCP